MTKDRFTDDKATIRDELEKRARARATMTYGEAAAMVGRANKELAPILNAIRDEEAEHGRPDLGCLVVRADTGFPAYVGMGQEERERAVSTRKAVFVAWKNLGFIEPTAVDGA